MKLKSLIFILFFSLSVFSEEVQTSATENKEVHFSSENQRTNKRHQLVISPVGFGPTATITRGVQMAIFLETNKLVLFEATTGRYESILFDNLFSNKTVNSQSVGFHYKEFVKNSFYYRMGFDYRKIQYEYTNFPLFSSSEKISFESDSAALNFQIGNQWQWENFTMGCDWVGLSLPIYSDVTNKKLNAAAQSSTGTDYNGKIDDESKYFSSAINGNFVRFYLGASF